MSAFTGLYSRSLFPTVFPQGKPTNGSCLQNPAGPAVATSALAGLLDMPPALNGAPPPTPLHLSPQLRL